jgi:hypothetical protein
MKTLRGLAVLLLAMGVSVASWGQTLFLEENFDYTAGTNLTDNGWSAHSGAGTNPVTVNSGGLSYSGYASSGIGNAALVDNTGEDVNRSFGDRTSGTIYTSFLVRVDAVATGYFLHLAKGSTTFAARVFVQSATGGFNFGVSNTSTGTFGSTVFGTGTTYLCVLKYDFATTNVSLWVFASGVPASEAEAGSPEVTNTGTGLDTLRMVALRQYSTSQNIVVDGIRVADSWLEAPLPVQISSLSASASRNGATVRWSTATETNNYGFEIERRSVSVGQTFLSVRSDEWLKVGFVPGAGTSTSPRNYSYTDEGVAPGRYAYRIKQIDNGGAFQYYGAAEVEVGIVAKEFALDQNYPNPFNPTTSVSFSLAEPGRAVVKVYNVVGQEIAVLFDQEAEAGRLYQVAFDASQLTTGVYLYTLESGGQRMVRRMALVR